MTLEFSEARARHIETDTVKAITANAAKVFADLGYGHTEKVYGDALAVTMNGMRVRREVPVPIYFEFEGRDYAVGTGYADFVCEASEASALVIELKVVYYSLGPMHVAQVKKYLAGLVDDYDHVVGLLINFKQPSWKEAAPDIQCQPVWL